MNIEDKPSISYVKSLDGLRAVAILLVLFDHWTPFKGVHDIAEFGRTGLLLFFMLSGYLITSVLLKARADIDSKKISIYVGFANFYMRRVLRILPAYLAAITIAAITYKAVRHDFFIHLFFLQNFTAGFALKPIYGEITHLWSLAVEEQFYLFWAPFVLLSLNHSRMLKVCIAAVLISICYKTIGALNDVSPWTLRMVTLGNIDSLAIGSLMAIDIKYQLINWSQGAAKKIRTSATYLAFLTIGIIVLSTELYGYKVIRLNHIYMIFHDTLMQLPLWVLLHKALNGGEKWMENRFFVWIGKRSYGIYVWHGQVREMMIFLSLKLFSYHLLPKFSYLSLFIFFTATLLVAELSWRFLESPFLKFKSKWS